MSLPSRPPGSAVSRAQAQAAAALARLACPPCRVTPLGFPSTVWLTKLKPGYLDPRRQLLGMARTDRSLPSRLPHRVHRSLRRRSIRCVWGSRSQARKSPVSSAVCRHWKQVTVTMCQRRRSPSRWPKRCRSLATACRGKAQLRSSSLSIGSGSQSSRSVPSAASSSNSQSATVTASTAAPDLNLE